MNENDNEYIEGLKVGKGCEHGHQTRLMLEHEEGKIVEIKDLLAKWEGKLTGLVFAVVVLAFFSGINVVEKAAVFMMGLK